MWHVLVEAIDGPARSNDGAVRSNDEAARSNDGGQMSGRLSK